MNKTKDGIPLFGERTKGSKCPAEIQEQVTFINEIKRLHPEYGAVVTHVKNEGLKSIKEAKKDKSAGLKAGACDIFIPTSPAFICELKRTNYTYKEQQNQIKYMLDAQKVGAFACVALGYKGAIEAFEYFLKEIKQ